MRKIILITLACLLCFSPADAQRRKTAKAVKAHKMVKTANVANVEDEDDEEEKSPQERLFEEILTSTAKVMFIDSVVVDKKSFLDKLQLSHEMGRIAKDGERVLYTNEFANIHVLASGDAVTGRSLYISHKYGEKWDEPVKIKELGSANNDYPFLMTDGVTLYFSAEGEGTIGGRDIFRTTFDTEESHFYEPVNVGLPFNSPANDYLLAISDYDNLGWLVSDRHQPEGKVCIYTFEPTVRRQTFDEDIEPEVLKSFALLNSIKDTWAFGDRKAALNRKLDIIKRINSKQNDDKISFVVNDNTVYTSLSDFKNPQDIQTFQQIVAAKRKLEQSKKLIDISRDSCAETPKDKRANIERNILQLESEISNLEQSIASEEKKLRNSLNK